MEQPAKPDAVLVLAPAAGLPACWPPASKARTPDKVRGKYVAEYLREALPVPAEGVPAITVRNYEYKYAHEDGIDLDWPADVPQVMPDFYLLSSHRFIVSQGLRDVLAELCPGCVEFIETRVDTPTGMLRAAACYYVNILPQAQMVDWPQVDMNIPTLKNGKSISDDGYCNKAIPYKPLRPGDPLIWHEMSLDREHRSDQGDVLVRGSVWNVLIERFPHQFATGAQLSRDE